MRFSLIGTLGQQVAGAPALSGLSAPPPAGTLLALGDGRGFRVVAPILLFRLRPPAPGQRTEESAIAELLDAAVVVEALDVNAADQLASLAAALAGRSHALAGSAGR